MLKRLRLHKVCSSYTTELNEKSKRAENWRRILGEVFLEKPPSIWKLKKILLFLDTFHYYSLFLVMLGLRCCALVFSSCSKQGLLLVVVHSLLIAVTSLVAVPGL